MAEIATLFFSPLLQAFFEKVASHEFVDFFRRRKLDDGLLKKMKIALLSVNGVLEDAEEKQLKSPTVKTWLDELKDAVFDAEDILDEIDTEALRSKLDAEYQTTVIKTLQEFVVSKHGGSSVGELGKLANLRGSLSISELQNVVSAADALDASLKNIKCLERLDLRWTADGNIVESQSVGVLNSLEPHTNLKELAISCYRGSSFSEWVGRSSFSKMTSLTLSNCKSCHVLPPIGQLPSLEHLEISGLDGIVTVGPEFYGTSACSSIKPFGALKSLEFANMPAWEKWIASFGAEDGAFFSNLGRLWIENCPKLTAALPIHLPSLAHLRIYNCPRLVASIPRAADLRGLDLTNCNGVPLQDLPAGLQHLSIEGYDSLESLPEGIIDSNSYLLSTLVISNCSKLELPMNFSFPSLQTLELTNSCNSLRSLQTLELMQ